jgi:hypothetical protein
MDPVMARRAPYPVRAHHKRCAKCGKLVSRAVYQCRRCGKRQRVRPRTIMLALAGCLMVGMFAVATASTLFTSHPVETASLPILAGGPEAVPAPTAIGDATVRPGHTAPDTGRSANLSAADLWMEYARDPAGADRRFRDRPVVVSGTVRSIERDFDGRLMVRLSTGEGLDTVNAKLAMRNDPAISVLGKGKPLSLGCVGRGALIGSPLLANCSVL